MAPHLLFIIHMKQALRWPQIIGSWTLLIFWAMSAFGYSTDSTKLQDLVVAKKKTALEKIHSIDQTLTIHLKEFSPSKASNETSSETTLREVNERIQILLSEKEELILQNQFWDRLFSRLQKAKLSGQQKDFLAKVFLEMAHEELLTPQPNKSLWQFLTNLSFALTHSLDINENAFQFVVSYMSYSGIQNPKSPQSFLAERDYVGLDIIEKAPTTNALDDLIVDTSIATNLSPTAEVQRTTVIPFQNVVEKALDSQTPH